LRTKFSDEFLVISGKIEVDPDAEAEAVATICMISTHPAVRVAESELVWIMSFNRVTYQHLI